MYSRKIFVLVISLLTWHFGWANDRGVHAAEGMIFSGLAPVAQTRVVPGGTLTLQATITNRDDQPGEGLLIGYLAGIPDVQGGCVVRLAPGEQREFLLRIPLPSSFGDKTYIEVLTSLKVNYGGREVTLGRNGAPSNDGMRLSVSQLKNFFGLAMDAPPHDLPSWYWPPQHLYSSYEMAIATRIDSQNSRLASNLEQDGLPLALADWSRLDLLIVSEPRALEDGAATEALRRYVHSGGRAWIMLDRVDCDLVRPLLEPGQMCELVDTIELNDFTVDISSQHETVAVQDRRVSLDRAVAMKRVLQSGGEVLLSVSGWPIAVVMPVGAGEVVLTTLDSRAWITDRHEHRSTDALYRSNYTLWPWGSLFSLRVNEGRKAPPLRLAVEYPLRHIGNPIVPRSWVMLAITGFCGLLAGAVIWRVAAGDLSPLGWIVPLAAVTVSGGLLVASTWVRRDIPESLSRLQIVDVSSDGTFAHVREQAAVCLSSESAMSLESTSEGYAQSSELVASGVRRFVNNDFQSWSLSNDAWPTGVWRYDDEYAVETADLVVTANLTTDGLTLDLPAGLPHALEDPVLGFTPGDPMLCQKRAESLVADGRISINSQRWIAGTLLTNEQERRMEIYQQLFRPDDQSAIASTRRLFGWTDLWTGPAWTHELAQNGSALVSLPIRLNRPKPQESVLIPHGMVGLRQKQGGVGRTTAYSESRSRWADGLSMAIHGEFQFVLPLEVVPFRADAIEFELDIQAPQRVVTVVATTASGDIELVRLQNPSIAWRETLTDPLVLQEAADGVLDITLEISDRTDLAPGVPPSSVVEWHVGHFHAGFRGAVQPD